jgi:hypothetical protein
MQKEHLFPSEELITQSDDKIITLTTRRIPYKTKSWGRAHLISMNLEKISSVEVRYKSWVIILLIGVLLCIAGLYFGANNAGDLMMAGVGLGFLCVVLYFVTRKHVITISSDGGAEINFHTSRIKDEKLMEFINMVEKAKSDLLRCVKQQ